MSDTPPIEQPKLVLHVCEGEKCADALAELGLVAVASQGGSGRAIETDWAPAARFDEVILWEDVDPADKETGVRPGEKYCATVAELIMQSAALLQTKPVVLIVSLRSQRDEVSGREIGGGMADGEDVFDKIESLKIEGMDNDAIRATLESLAYQLGRRWMVRAPIEFPNQPKPLELRGERQDLCNFGDGWAARPLEEIRASVMDVAKGWPCRLLAPGARTPMLFIKVAQSQRLRWIAGSEAFQSWMHEIGRLKFMPKSDTKNANYVTPTNVFHYLGGANQVTEFVAVEARPHEPLIPGHYYDWEPPADYEPTGEYLAELISFFANAKDANARAIIAAAILTVAWGGPYGKRPCFVVTAPDRGCGKTTLVWAIGRVFAGMMDIELGKRAEEDLITRLLTPEALSKRVAVLDNVKGVVNSPTLEKLITCETINGRRLYSGDGSRPNVLTYFITANGVRLSRDMGQRAFFIELTRPKPSPEWERRVSAFVATNADYVVADCLAILRDKKSFKGGATSYSDRWALWCDEVLEVACTHPALAKVVGKVDVNEVIDANRKLREDTDEDMEEAEIFSGRVLDLVAREEGLIGEWSSMGVTQPTFKDPIEAVFIPSEKMCEYWLAIFNRKVNTRWLKHQLREHREAGRIKGFEEKHTRAGNGYEIGVDVMAKYVQAARAEHDQKSSVSALAGSGGGQESANSEPYT